MPTKDAVVMMVVMVPASARDKRELKVKESSRKDTTEKHAESPKTVTARILRMIHNAVQSSVRESALLDT